MISLGTRVVLISGCVGLFLVVLGFLTVTPALIEAWQGYPGTHRLLTLWPFGVELSLTSELVRVAGFLAAYTGLYFAVSITRDDHYHKEFLEPMLADVRRACAVRAVYLSLINRERGSAEPWPASR